MVRAVWDLLLKMQVHVKLAIVLLWIVCVCVSVRVVGVEIVGVGLCSGDVAGDSMEGSFWAIQESRGKFGQKIACCGEGCDIFGFGDFT